MGGRDTLRFGLVVCSSLLLGAALAAGQSIVFDPDGSPAASIPGSVDVQSGQYDAGTTPPALDIGGSWIRIGDADGATSQPNGLGIKFTDLGQSHGTLYYDSANERFVLCESSGSSVLTCDTGSETLRVNVNTGEVTVPNGDLNLGGNTITNVGGTDCAADETLLGDGTCGKTGGIPAGTVIFYNGTACPADWSELTAARGRAVVGLPSGGAAQATVGAALSDQESRTHTHSVNPPSTGSTSSGSHKHLTAIPSIGGTGGSGMSTDAEDDAPWGYGTCTNCGSAERDEVNTVTSGVDSWAWSSTDGSHSHSVDIGSFSSGSAAETMPYIQLLVCVKD